MPPPSSLATVEKDSDSQIRNALCYTEELSASLHGEIGALENRLETGLTPVPPAPAGASTSGQDSTAHSHILERIGSANRMLTAAIARLRELRMRVEL